jgi:hypothetical protein
LLKSLLGASYDHDHASGASTSGAGSASSDKHLKGVHELLHGVPSSVTAPGDLLLMSFYLAQVILFTR